MRLALYGDPLPIDPLIHVLRRNRAEQDVSRERAVVIKMVLGSRRKLSVKKERDLNPMEALDETAPSVGYRLGRLLCTLDVIQRRALGNENVVGGDDEAARLRELRGPNTTNIDKFFGSASSAPATAFPTMIRNAVTHLAAIRKDNFGTADALQREIEEIVEPIGYSFPLTLSLEEQGAFDLGYFHQRAQNRRRASGR
jgi:CRISPR-associated protein Csd1